MKIFTIFAILICITIILPTTVGVKHPAQRRRVCNCSCPKPQIPDNQFYRTDRLRRCPKCPPTTCVCPTCSATPKTAKRKSVKPSRSRKPVPKVAKVPAKKSIPCKCPKCPPIIHPKKNVDTGVYALK